MADLTAELAPDYLARGLELSAEDFPAVTVSADPSQLRRVVTNIWDNSAKYKVRDVGRGFISLDAGGVLTLSDDGPGVPEEALPKLFDAFYRSDPARKNPAGGSGLGLAIAARAVQRMGGAIQAIQAFQAPAGGLAIQITLPLEGT